MLYLFFYSYEKTVVYKAVYPFLLNSLQVIEIVDLIPNVCMWFQVKKIDIYLYSQ